MLQINLTSFNANSVILMIIVRNLRPDVLILQELGLNPDFSALSGDYVVHYRPRPGGRKGGGVAVLVMRSILEGVKEGETSEGGGNECDTNIARNQSRRIVVYEFSSPPYHNCSDLTALLPQYFPRYQLDCTTEPST